MKDAWLRPGVLHAIRRGFGAGLAARPRHARPRLTVNLGQEEVCWEISTDNFTAGTTTVTGAHIHSAFEGQNGPIVVPLTAELDGTSSGCTTVAREVADAIVKAPQVFYVNVHTNLYPAGAIRGQLDD